MLRKSFQYIARNFSSTHHDALAKKSHDFAELLRRSNPKEIEARVAELKEQILINFDGFLNKNNIFIPEKIDILPSNFYAMTHTNFPLLLNPLRVADSRSKYNLPTHILSPYGATQIFHIIDPKIPSIDNIQIATHLTAARFKGNYVKHTEVGSVIYLPQSRTSGVISAQDILFHASAEDLETIRKYILDPHHNMESSREGSRTL